MEPGVGGRETAAQADRFGDLAWICMHLRVVRYLSKTSMLTRSGVRSKHA